jgi:two-component system, NtrC family, sensor kinase
MIFSLPCIFLLKNRFVTAHAVRRAIRKASIHLILQEIANRDDFLGSVHVHRPNLVLTGEEGLPDLSLAELLEFSRSSEPIVSVVVLGEDQVVDTALRAIREGASDYLGISQLDRLPSVLERTLRDREADNAASRLRHEMRRAADAMRENQKMITIGRLTASIAHEINNPLASVTNLLYLISSEPGLPENVRKYLDLAQGELQRVVQISRQTLSFYRESAEPVHLRLSTLLEEVLVLYARRLIDKHIEIVRQYIDDEEITVFPGEIRQVFSNLITNAIEASEKGGRLLLRLRRSRLWSDEEVCGLRISIGDTGSGIDPEVRHRLGEPFFTTKGELGTGLGLWVTQSIVKRYGGHLWLHSSTRPERHGTIFSIFLPTNLGPKAIPSHTVEAAKASGLDFVPRKSGNEKNTRSSLTDGEVIPMPEPRSSLRASGGE